MGQSVFCITRVQLTLNKHRTECVFSFAGKVSGVGVGVKAAALSSSLNPRFPFSPCSEDESGTVLERSLGAVDSLHSLVVRVKRGLQVGFGFIDHAHSLQSELTTADEIWTHLRGKNPHVQGC